MSVERILALGFWALVACGRGPDDAGAERSAPAVALDPRLDYLLAPCAQGGHYDVNTSDLGALFAYALQHGQRDALRRSKGELAALGASGIEIARRVARAHWNEPDKKADVRNAIDVALLSTEPVAREFLLEASGHPMEDLRLLALEGLPRFQHPEDWDLVHEALSASSGAFAPRIVGSLWKIDRARTADLLLDWLEAGAYESIWPEVLPLLAGVEDPAGVARCAELWPKVLPAFAVWLAAPCARAGDAEAHAALSAWSQDEDGAVRARALNALSQAEQLDEVAAALAGDPSPENRKLAAALLSTPPERLERTREAVRAGTSDSNAAVAQMCLEALAQVGDETAIERGLELLTTGGGSSANDALLILGEALRERPDLARRALEALTAELEARAHRPLSERIGLLVAVSRLPLAEAAELLLELGAAETEAFVQGQSSARWFAMQAGNVGEPAHALLLERFQGATDPLARIDWLEALTLRGEPAARDRVLELIEADQLTPYELLYVAERLVRIGPAAIVAPAIKRATLRTDQNDARRGLQCLLWSSYPGPSESQAGG